MNHNELIADSDFCMKIVDDSMKNSRILRGDIVYVKKCIPKNGEIAVVQRGNTAVIGRLFMENEITLLFPDNPDYEPIELFGNVVFLGKAVGFQSSLLRTANVNKIK